MFLRAIILLGGTVVLIGGAPLCAQYPRYTGTSYIGSYQPPGTGSLYTSPAYGYLSRPPVGPYLNLLNRGNPAVNYYGIVRPELEFRATLNTQRGVTTRLEREVQQDLPKFDDVLPHTGHRSYFLNYSHYYYGSVP